MAAARIKFVQGDVVPGRRWAVVGEVLDVEPIRDVGYGEMLFLWIDVDGATVRIAIPRSDVGRLRAEIDAAEAAFDDDDDDEGD